MASAEAMPLVKLATPALDERSRYLRKLVVRALEGGERGHIGSSMSLIEIMRVLYDDVLRYRPAEPGWRDRDRMILSKGHGCLALYAMLADKGFFPLDTLDTFCRRDSILGGHPEAGKVPGVEASTGSARARPVDRARHGARRPRCTSATAGSSSLMGDGEINEGSVWEAAMCAGKHRLSNLTAMIDYNKIQSAGIVSEIQDMEPLARQVARLRFRAPSKSTATTSTTLRARLPRGCRSAPGPAARRDLPYGQRQGHPACREQSRLAPQVQAQPTS